MHSASEPVAILQRWGLATPASKGPKARYTLDEIVATAVALADSDGHEAVTLAAVASRLGITTTALYRYVDSKDTLVELMVDAALGEPPASRRTTPDRRLDALLDALWSRYIGHPWLTTLQPRRAPRCPHAIAWLDALVAELRGLGDPSALATAMSLDVLVRGDAAQAEAAEHSELSEELAQEIARRHPELDADMTAAAEPRRDLDAAVARLLAR